MPFNLRNWIGVVFLLAVALGTWYWSQLETAAQLGGPSTPVPEGYYLRNAVLSATAEDGRILYRILAAKAEELPVRQRLLLTDVEVEYRQGNHEVPWRLSAATAEGPTDRSYLDLSGNVRLIGTVNGTGPVIVETNRLRLEPETFIARSDEAVDIVIGRQRMSGVGLRAYLLDDRLELESQVHGQLLR